ncbi:hypothetical protein [Methylobacterium sp. WL1]|uniref:hypothetical protein n=1 Tax=Methylobacterium sp. WL1 TaxID=2603276 RepID=UPI001FF037D2|nr:hypothetical protein [Methylobacterium sp. WL1]
MATLTRRPNLEPGHQALVTFAGLPALTLSPTLRIDGSAEINEAVFHIPRDPEGGPVDAIRLDQPVRLKGPVGRGQYRPGGGRLVLVAAGAGFGPIWAIARRPATSSPPARWRWRSAPGRPRPLHAREPGLAALHRRRPDRALRRPRRPAAAGRALRPLTAHLPSLRATDVVHVAGDIATVGAVQVLAAAVGARCYPIVLD